MALYYDEILAGNCFGQINVSPPPPPSISPKSNTTNAIVQNNSSSLLEQYALTAEELYVVAKRFLKEQKCNQNLQLKYNDNVVLAALSRQAKFGKWNASHTEDIGFFDVVGNDRKRAWVALGDMPKEQAMEEYAKLLFDRCILFRTYLEAEHRDQVDDNELRQDYETHDKLEKEAEQARRHELEQLLRLEKQKRKREHLQRKQIQDVLNQQTYPQFKAYAQQQYRDNQSAQEELIQQLQEQHFQQYIKQVYQQQLLDQQSRANKAMEQSSENTVPLPSTPTNTQSPTAYVADISTSQTSIDIAPATVSANVVNSVSPVPETSSLPMANGGELGDSSNSNIHLHSIPQLPPLGPAPAQLPPLIHAPPFQIASTHAIQQDIQLESVSPVPTHFEALNINEPSASISSGFAQLSLSADIAQSSLPSIDITNELNISHQLADNDSATPPSSIVDPNTAISSHTDSNVATQQDKEELPAIAAANMWTRKDIKEFKDQIRKEADAIIKVGSGETVTVRVPTHEDGRSIFWEFATDYYDLGFGVYFEWIKSETNAVTVHVSDSSDEEEENEDAEKKDVEKGSGSTNKPPKPRQSEILPIYRRDCHEEVYAGSHSYPGHGVYLLKFDNSYSLWRSKTLYYRVYYSK